MAAKRPLGDSDRVTEGRPSNARRSPQGHSASPEPRHAPTLPFGINDPRATSSRSERLLPLPAPNSSRAARLAPLQSLPPMWRPDQSQPGSQVYYQHPASTQISPDGFQEVKRENAAMLTHGVRSTVSGSDSDQGTSSRSPLTARMSADEVRRLKDKMFGLQAQVEELRGQLDIVQQHASAKDAQYASIIAQSAQRETQNLAESQKWQKDKDLWVEERRLLQETIADLTARVQELRSYVDPATSPSSARQLRASSHSTPVTPPPSSSSVSTFAPDALVIPSSDDKVPLSTLRNEGDRIIEQGARLMEAGRSIQRQLDSLREQIP